MDTVPVRDEQFNGPVEAVSLNVDAFQVLGNRNAGRIAEAGRLADIRRAVLSETAERAETEAVRAEDENRVARPVHHIDIAPGIRGDAFRALQPGRIRELHPELLLGGVVGGVAVEQNLPLAGLGYQITLVNPGIGEIPVRNVGLERPDEACGSKARAASGNENRVAVEPLGETHQVGVTAAVGAHEGQGRHQRNHQTRLTRYRKFHGTENRVRPSPVTRIEAVSPRG